MDPAAALNILQQHSKSKQAELAQTPPMEQAAMANPTQQVINMAGAPSAVSPAPPAVDAADAGEPEDVDVSHLPAPELLARVRTLQRDRTATYKQYDAALAACSPGEGRQGDPAAYATVVAQVTVVFDRISKRANACEAALRARGLAAAADCIRRLQNYEKEKLELTAARHLGAFRPDTDAAAAHLGRRSLDVVAQINEALEDLACELDGEE